MRRKLENGAPTRFWLDMWCRDVLLSVRLPRLFVVVVNGKSMLSDYCARHMWEIAWRIPIVVGILVTQLQ